MVAPIPAGRVVRAFWSSLVHTWERILRSRTWNFRFGESPSTSGTRRLNNRWKVPTNSAIEVPRPDAKI